MTDMPFEVAIVADSQRYDVTSDAWSDQEHDLWTALRKETRLSMQPVPPDLDIPVKGLAETVVLALTSVHVVRGVVDCVRAWLERDQTRRITFAVKTQDQTEVIVLEGNRIDPAAFARLEEVLRSRIGG